MTRDERLEFCKICNQRKLDVNIGLICSVTMKHADFEESCSDFQKDDNEKDRLLRRELESAGREDVGDPLDAQKNKRQGSSLLLIGLLITVVSHGLSAATGFFVITYGTIIYGARQYMKGVEQEKILEKENKKK